MKDIFFTPGPSELFFTVEDHIKNGFRKDRLEFSNDPEYTAETHAILDKINSLASK